jgi:1-phosphatidylinositol-4-phosphate 5-kinase
LARRSEFESDDPGLQGSAIGRLYPEEKAKQNPHATLKDLNWVQRQRQFWLGPEKKVLFEEQLRRDTELLQRLGIMDYSLLTGIHNLFKGNSEGLREEKLSVFQVRSDSGQPTDAGR